jgi:hypothetical protein
VASALTSKDVDDAVQVGPLLSQVAGPVISFTGEGAYDQDGAYADVAGRHPDAAVIVPPRSTAVLSATATTAPTQRDRHLKCIAERGCMGWQKTSDYKQASQRRGIDRAMETSDRRWVTCAHRRASGD